ncbi:MAG: hypothetical protein J6V33_03060 [Bacteroidales bacterium]|nr:hypothetical protein [Bacteroidales bacterium]
MGRQLKNKMLKDDFKTIDIDFQININDNDVVKIVNDLPTEERNLIIDYIVCNSHYSPLAKKYKVSTPLIKERITSIINKIKTEYNEYI